MKTCVSRNSIPYRKLLKKYKLKLRAKQETIKEAQKRSATRSGFNILTRKILLKI